MFQYNNIQNQYFGHFLDGLSAEDPLSLLNSVISLNAELSNAQNVESCKKKIDFYFYELQSKCEDLFEDDRLNLFNSYFFDQKKLQVAPLKPSCLDELFIDQLIVKGSASALPVSILYSNLASRLNIPIYFMNSRHFHIVKWMQNGRSYYLNLACGGQILCQQELLSLVCTENHEDRESCLEILPLKKVFELYLNEMIQLLEKSAQFDKLKLCLDLALHIDSSQFGLLAKRAVVNNRLGNGKEALCDLKRYFAFNDISCAPHELRTTYQELSRFYDLSSNSTTNIDFLH